MAHISSWNKTLSALLLLRNYPKADFGRVSPLKGSRPVFLQGSSFLPPIKKARKKERKKKMSGSLGKVWSHKKNLTQSLYLISRLHLQFWHTSPLEIEGLLRPDKPCVNIKTSVS